MIIDDQRNIRNLQENKLTVDLIFVAPNPIVVLNAIKVIDKSFNFSYPLSIIFSQPIANGTFMNMYRFTLSFRFENAKDMIIHEIIYRRKISVILKSMRILHDMITTEQYKDREFFGSEAYHKVADTVKSLSKSEQYDLLTKVEREIWWSPINVLKIELAKLILVFKGI